MYGSLVLAHGLFGLSDFCFATLPDFPPRLMQLSAHGCELLLKRGLLCLERTYLVLCHRQFAAHAVELFMTRGGEQPRLLQLDRQLSHALLQGSSALLEMTLRR